MANEFKHLSVGGEITQAEYEAVGGHILDSQAIGDIIYATSTSQLSRLGIGSTGAVLTVTGGVPAWDTTWTPTGHLIPASDDSYDLGSAAAAWQDLFLEGDISLTDAGSISTAAGALTIGSAAAINITPTAGSAILLDGTISIDAGVVTGATSVTSTAFVGDITGDVTGNADTVTTNANLTGHITSSGNAAVLGSFTSAQLSAALTNETGSGVAVFNTSPTLVTPALGTPASGVLTNTTGYTGDTSLVTTGVLNSGSINTGFGVINNGASAITTTGLVSAGSLTVTGTTTLNGNLILGDAAADSLTIAATIQGATPLIFEGANALGDNDHETTFAITDPTADRTITFPDASLTVNAAANISGTTLASNVVTSSLTAVGTIATGVWGATDVGVAHGGTGASTAAAGFDALAPMTASGDIIYGGASGTGTRLAKGSDADVLTLASGVPTWATPTVGDITGVTAGVGLSGGGTSGALTITLDLSELSTVTPADGDFFSTLDSDGANEQKTTTTALATLFAGTGLTASSSVIGVDASQTQITSVGALNAGSITSGFTSIDVGSGTIDTTGAVSTGALTLSGALISSTDGTLDIGTDAAPFQKAYLQLLQIEQLSGDAGIIINAESADTDPYIVFQTESASKWGWSYDSSSDFFGLYNYSTSTYPLAFLDASSDVILQATGKLRLDYNGSGNSYLHEASADVVEVVAGGVAVGFNANGMEIPDSKFIEFASAAGTPTTDNSVQGVVIEFLAAEAITQFDAVYVSTTTGRVGRALATNAAKMPVIGIAIEAQGSAGSSVRVLTHGVYRDDGGFGADMTVGAKLYAPEALGTLTTTMPTTDGDLVQVMGVATGVRSAFINPSMDIIEHA